MKHPSDAGDSIGSPYPIRARQRLARAGQAMQGGDTKRGPGHLGPKLIKEGSGRESGTPVAPRSEGALTLLLTANSWDEDQAADGLPAS